MKITDFNVAIVETDDHLSRWVQEQRRLNVQEEYLSQFKQYIPQGGTVIDVGACIGDHTITYARMVGEHGRVHAFEPNPEAYECLEYNTKHLPQVRRYWMALGSLVGYGRMAYREDQPNNLGAAWLVKDENGLVEVRALDHIRLQSDRVDFIKIDAEGFEPDILDGAMNLIEKNKPVMLIEFNRAALARQGKTVRDLERRLLMQGYLWLPSEPHHNMDMEQLDVLAVHGGL